MGFNFKNLIKITSTKEECITWCLMVGLLKDKRWCSKGKHWVEWSKRDADDDSTATLNREFRCKHGARRSAANDTWFERHKIGMDDLLLITYAFSQKWSYSQVIHEIDEEGRKGLSSETIADVYMFCREVKLLLLRIR